VRVGNGGEGLRGVDEDDVGALPRGDDGVRATLASATTGDEYDFAVEKTQEICSFVLSARAMKARRVCTPRQVPIGDRL
jgi:hypothetical protein